jgi:hypothetical protein
MRRREYKGERTAPLSEFQVGLQEDGCIHPRSVEKSRAHDFKEQDY